MNGLPTGRVIRQSLVMSALLSCAGEVWAAEPVGSVSPAHGPMLMLYVSQPLLSGASRTYGLRLNQTSAPPNPMTLAPTATASGFYAGSPRRSLVDLQIGRRSDVRLQFGNRVAWNLRSREFEFPNARPSKPIDFAVNAR